MRNTMIGGFIQYDVYNQVLLGDTIEAVHDAARAWLINKGVDVPEDVPFDEWYGDDDNVPTNVYYWISDNPVVVNPVSMGDYPKLSVSVTFTLERIPTDEDRTYYIEQVDYAMWRQKMEVGISHEDNVILGIDVR